MEHFRTALSVSESLERLVAPSFGPCGLDCLVTSATGDILVSNDGFHILGAIDVRRPCGKLILDAMKMHHGRHGGNSKAFILMLTAALRKINALADSIQNIARLARLLAAEWIRKYDVINRKILEISVRDVDYGDVIETFLRGKFGPKVRTTLRGLIQNLSLSSELIDWLDVCSIQVAGLPLERSCTVNGIVINRDLNYSRNTHPSPHFIVVKESLTFPAPTRASFTAGHHSSLTDLLSQEKSFLNRVSTHLKQRGVSLVLCTENISIKFAQLFHREGISTVSHIPEEDATFICTTLSIEPCSLLDCLDLSPKALHRFTEVDTLTIGRETCTHIRGVPGAYLILCGPTRGITKVYYNAIYNGLKMLRVWLEVSKGLAVPGAGAAELALAHHAEKHVERPISLILQAMLLSVPKALHENSHAIRKNRRGRFIEVLSRWECLSGIDSNSGDLIVPRHLGIVEPKANLLNLVQDVISLVVQICRIDGIVSVRRFPPKNDDDTNEEL
ncbi:uncharacterized protein [Oscarella lobularis]|uniref:uncharacterized protein n=1 Tax=Oscarella lobularis TaxID=121494 RepID=UPI00331359D3